MCRVTEQGVHLHRRMTEVVRKDFMEEAVMRDSVAVKSRWGEGRSYWHHIRVMVFVDMLDRS